jgi:hypothetical protein
VPLDSSAGSIVALLHLTEAIFNTPCKALTRFVNGTGRSAQEAPIAIQDFTYKAVSKAEESSAQAGRRPARVAPTVHAFT